MEPLAILKAFDKVPERELLESIVNWMLDISLGIIEYKEDGEHLVQESIHRWKTKPIKQAITLALTAADMRMEMALSQNYEDTINTHTAHMRKIEFIDDLVVKQLEQILHSSMNESNSKLGIKNQAIKTQAYSQLAKDIENDLFDMIKTSYASVGGNAKIKKVDDISNEYPEWVLMDVDEDPEADVAFFGRPTNFGTKLGASATDGTSVAKEASIQLRGELLRNGWWAEVSDAPAHIALNKLKMLPIEDREAVVELLSGKDIEWHGEHPQGKFPGTYGWYTRDIGGEKHTKIIVGKFN